MPNADHPLPNSAPPSPDALVAKVQALLCTLTDIAHTTPASPALAACPDALGHICTILSNMASTMDAGRADLLAQRQNQLNTLMTALSNSVSALRDANERAATQIAERTDEFGQVAASTPDAHTAARLRDITTDMHTVAQALGTRLSALAAQAQKATDRAAALETQVSPAAKPASHTDRQEVHTREEFDERLRFFIATGPFREPWSLLLADLDSLDELSEHFGVSPCEFLLDRINQALARRIQVRYPDAFAAEYQDGAFAVIVPGEPAVAADLADELHRAIPAVSWTVSNRKGSTALTTTATIGVGAYRVGDTAATLAARAQQALADAESQGPDHVADAEA